MNLKLSLVAFAIVFIFVLSCKKDNSSTPPTTPSDVKLSNGLMVYLPFDGNMADSSSNGNTTTPVGGASLTYDEHGYSNSAFGSTGNGERILVTNNGSIKFDTAYTLSYDFMIRSAGQQAFISMVTDATGKGPSFISGTPTVGSSTLEFSAVDSTTGCDSYGGIAVSADDISAFQPQLESWYNFTTVYHKGLVQMYINGTLISTKTDSIPVANLCPAAQMVIGGWWSGGPISINGKLDEIRFYNRVLNADEIAELAKDFQPID